MIKLAPQRQHRHHRTGAILLAVPRSQPVPQFVVAGGPATGRAPLRQRPGPGERAGLMAQDVQVMLEIQHMLAAAVTALVAGDQATCVPDLDMKRMHTRFYPGTRADGHRVEVGLHRDAALLVDQREHDFRQVEAFRRPGQQMAALLGQRGADGLRAAVQHPRLVRAAADQQQRVQRIEVGNTRHGDQVIAPEIAAFAFNAALLVTFARRAEFRGKPPV
jgi:hypothetical protein